MLASVPGAVFGLVHAVDDVAAEVIDNATGHALGDDLAAIRRQIDRLEGEFIRRLHRFDLSGAAISEGATNTVSWMRSTCGLTGGAAADRLRMARVLAELPQTAESLAAGRAPFTNVSMIARLADDVGTDAARTVEPMLVDAAENVDAARMYHLTSSTRLRLDAEASLDTANRNYQRRWFTCDQGLAGMFELRGELDSEGGALLKTALEALSSPAGPDDDRSGAQRRADALVDLADRQLQSSTLPVSHGQRPHLVVTASLEALRGSATGALPELRHVGPIHPETARRLACDAASTLATTAASGVPFAVGRSARTIPSALWKALVLRDGGCRFPRCDRPPGWTDAHHIRHRADGGQTTLDNLVLLCRRHHRRVHEERWAIRFGSDGAVEITPPAGSRPPRAQRRLLRVP